MDLQWGQRSCWISEVLGWGPAHSQCMYNPLWSSNYASSIASHPVAIYLTFAFLFLLYALLSVISTVCVMCVAIRRNIVCAKRSIRTYVQRTTVQHKVTKPHGLYIIMSRTLHTHISPHHMNTHTYTPCCCSTLYESHSIGNWLGSIACWVKDLVGWGEGHTSGWELGRRKRNL